MNEEEKESFELLKPKNKEEGGQKDGNINGR